MATKKNMFAEAAERRQEEQQALESEIKEAAKKKPTNKGNDTVKVAAEPEINEDDDKKVPMNISLPLRYKKRLIAYAKEKCLPASVVLQVLIDEHCN